jgi:hypothetical protein
MISDTKGFRIQIFEQKVTKKTKRVMFVGNGSSLPSFPSVKVRKDRLVRITRQVDSGFLRLDPQAFLSELLFLLCGLCDEIGLWNLGQTIRVSPALAFRRRPRQIARPVL